MEFFGAFVRTESVLSRFAQACWKLRRDLKPVSLACSAALEQMRAAVTLVGDDGSAESAWHQDVARRLDGMVSLGSLAAIRSGGTADAIRLVEDGTLTICRALALRIDWEAASQAEPDLIDRLTVLRNGIRIGSGAAISEMLEYETLMEDLRSSLGIVAAIPTFSWSMLEGARLLWIGATELGGFAIYFDGGAPRAIELPLLTSEAVTSWTALLHPPRTGDQLRLRWMASSGRPERRAIEQVVQELDTATYPCREFLTSAEFDNSGCGVSHSPWQARHTVNCHLSATFARSPRAGALPLVEEPVIVFANPRHDLPGADREARAMSASGGESLCWRGGHSACPRRT